MITLIQIFLYLIIFTTLILSITAIIISNKNIEAKKGPIGPMGQKGPIRPKGLMGPKGPKGPMGPKGTCQTTCKSNTWSQMHSTPILNLLGNSNLAPSVLIGTVIFFKQVDKHKRYDIFLSLPIISASNTQITPIKFDVMDMIQKEKEEYMGSSEISFNLKTGTNQYYFPNIIPDKNGYIYIKTDNSSDFLKLINKKFIFDMASFVMYKEV